MEHPGGWEAYWAKAISTGAKLNQFLIKGKEKTVTKSLVVLLVISVVGNLIGVYAVYKYFAAKKSVDYVRADLEKTNKVIEDLTGVLDRLYSKKMIFLHHSVGRGILYEGGLRDSLLEMGVLVKGATYGDEIGQKTDINDWLPKFQRDMNQILGFKAHPNLYYAGNESNDIVMFKSCFPNSNIQSEGSDPGDPVSGERTTANYKAAFLKIADEISKYPDKLYIYVTSPPLVTEKTNPNNASRAKSFNNWLITEYLPEYEKTTGLSNLVIFDLFEVLADENGYLKKSYRRVEQGDSHPNVEANRVAAAKFMEFFRPVWESWQARTVDQGV